MSIFSSGAKGLSKLISPAEKAASDFIKGASNIIPGETKTGQTMLFPAGSFKAPKPKPGDMKGTAVRLNPPFKASGFGRPAPGSSARLARQAELVAKRKTKKPVPGSITPAPPRVPVAGPKSKEVSFVDDLFGVPGKPLGFK